MKKCVGVTVFCLCFFSLALSQQGYQQSTQYGVVIEDVKGLEEICPEKPGGGLGYGEDVITKGRAEKIVNKILDDLGIPNLYTLRECKAAAKGNAYAKIYRVDGISRKFILYDVDFLNEVAIKMDDPNAPADAAAAFILAHEIGHHIRDHTFNYGESNPRIELEADDYAGYQMARGKYSLSDVLQTPRTEKLLITNEFKSTHPGRIDRMKAAYTGWYRYAVKDSLFLNQNKTDIAEYKKEIIALEKEANGVVNTEDLRVVKKKEDPIVVAQKEEEKKEQDEAAKVIDRYFEALGGLARVNNIKTMSYQEIVTRSDSPGELVFNYNQQSTTRVVIDAGMMQYKISNDSLSHRFKKKKTWREGKPKTERLDERTLLSVIGSSTGDFLEDFNLFGNPDLVALKDTVDFQGNRCYKLEVKEKKENINMNDQNTGNRRVLSQFRYYGVEDGLLHGIESIETEQEFKKGKQVSYYKTITVTTHEDYKEIKGIKFPRGYTINTQRFNGTKLEEELLVTKKVEGITFESQAEPEP